MAEFLDPMFLQSSGRSAVGTLLAPMNSRRLIASSKAQGEGIVPSQTNTLNGTFMCAVHQSEPFGINALVQSDLRACRTVQKPL